jgi:hypothetical protein
MNDRERELESFLADLRRELRGVPEELVADAVAELRSHVRDSLGGDATGDELRAVLARLGSPGELAGRYRGEAWGGAPRSPAGRRGAARPLLAACELVATVGAWVLALVPVYLLAGSLLAAALAKPLVPARVGLWRSGDEYSLHLGWGKGAPAAGDELLGWWIVPLGLAAAGGAGRLTVRLAARARQRHEEGGWPALAGPAPAGMPRR